MATVSFRDATRVYPGADTPAVDRLNLDINDGEFMVLVGPSGCGKSTTLRMLAGLEEVTSGSVWIGEQDVTELPPKDRDLAMVFQNYALYPHMTVGENMGFALKMQNVPKEEREHRVMEAAKLLGLEEFLDRWPKALSGGQRQRVAMGRAIVRQPQVFLMDEPLSNLDAKLRVSTRTQIAALQTRLEVTTLYVTHDQVEAMTLGDRVAVMREGVLQQVDSPLALWDTPKNVFVASFIGTPPMNLMPGTPVDGGIRIGKHVLAMPRETVERITDDEVTVGIRPDNLVITDSPEDAEFHVEKVELPGSDAYLYGTIDGAGPEVCARVQTRRPPQAGERVRLGVAEDRIHLFSTRTGDRIS
ncbi:ABC transporter ATP-binding protein [Granulicoccus phenolivorans]|uniref:ABC transporter ATP-binding protein n=1 Tax=Granulicoccus phenolivorans TaxID=266854 RepID=UPI0004040848|nr:sn-glycerol-3-phosphate ABC transporter ATP-binding protein UgpC [Granulicoccus phenolivorans]